MEMSEPSGHSDGDLVRAALAGSEVAFGELVRRYQDILYRHAERMTGRGDDAEDIVQSAFIKAYAKLRRCRDPEKVGAWLFRIGANACKDFLKSRRRRDLSLDDIPQMSGEEGDPERSLNRTLVVGEIERALRRLPLEQREAFLLKHVEGRSYTEMADMLGASVPALKMRVHRAREELQVLLEAYRR